ncbi:hypothetical protein [Halorussus salinisoli]|uniref:hypothetical protein n=1 Tax=Halorussus salinisoli TaxID=2558242 RepID=UPI0010C21388|nr:hypothetical protein [Halorussus salinisoli]
MPDETHSTSKEVSRRTVLRSGATAVAGGSLLTPLSGRARATSHDESHRPLDVRTTDVEILGEDGAETTGKAKTTGAVDGMEKVDCERCKVGAQVAHHGHDEWYGGLQRVVTARTSFRVAVTLAGLRPGKYQFRLVACPITHDALCFGNSITVVVRGHGRKKEKHGKKKHGKEKKHEKKKRKKRGKKDRCPCGRDHGGKHHLTLCGGDWRSANEYAFEVSGGGIRRSGRSCAPSVVGHDAISVDRSDRIRDDIVTGALAGGGDSFLFSGDLTDLRCDDGVSVYLDGQRFDGY